MTSAGRAASLLAAILLAESAIAPVLAQVAPTAAEARAYTGLHLAAHTNDVAAIRRLAEAGADLNARVENGRAPIHVAAFASNDEALIALAGAGADMNLLEDDRYDVVTIAAVANDPEMVSLAIEKGNRADLVTSIYDGTALIAAAHLGHHEVVRRLIAGGAPLDHVNNLNWTALIEAVILGDGGPDHTETVRALAEAGADATIPDGRGRTPLDLARARGFAEMVAILEAAERR